MTMCVWVGRQLCPQPSNRFRQRPQQARPPMQRVWLGQPVVEDEAEFFGYWRIQRYTLFLGNTTTHFMANAHIDRKPGGAHQILRELQEVDLGLRRFPLSHEYDP